MSDSSARAGDWPRAPGAFEANTFQPEIQGLRAVAVVAVIWAHAGLPGLPGGFTGVDVFFVISGFLITRLLLTEAGQTGRIDLLAFWARRARRLLPNAYAALLGTLILALAVFPVAQPSLLTGDVVWAALEIVNFRFAQKAVDYFAQDSAVSPVLHFWSLSVEEQFYLAWPPLLAGLWIAWPAHRRALVVGALGLVWCASFAASYRLTWLDQPLAYFHTGTRCWQLTTGALLAAGWPAVERLPARLRTGMAWLGASGIVLGVALIEGDTGYPGAFALLPTLGAAGLIAGYGAAGVHSPLRRALSHPLMQWTGARSYSWYLWHWPLIALPSAAYPDSPFVALIAVPVSLAVACAAYSWIETPLRSGPALTAAPWRTFAGAAAGLAVVTLAAYGYRPALERIDPASASRIAMIEAAWKERTLANRDGCVNDSRRTEILPCLYGDPSGKAHAVLLGDSHADHWFPAVDAAARETGWRLTARMKSGCPAASFTIASANGPNAECDVWREAVLQHIATDIPDLVIISSQAFLDKTNRLDPVTARPLSDGEASQVWRDGMRKTIQRLTGAGIAVMVIRDIPVADRNYRSCIVRRDDCATPRARALRHLPVDIEAAGAFGDMVAVADFTDRFCDAARCPALADGLLRYRDSTHLTPSFAATFAPDIARFLRSLTPAHTPHGAPKVADSLP